MIAAGAPEARDEARWAFRPSVLLRSAHLQTLAGMYLAPPPALRPERSHRVALPDGDALAVHENVPEGAPVRRVALLLHGLGGTHDSAYMRHAARRLVAAGFAACRLDLRGAGAAADLCVRHYHSGCVEDVDAAVRAVGGRFPGASLDVIGFSLGGAILLRWLAVQGAAARSRVGRCVAICPPVDLAASQRRLSAAALGLYDRYLADRLRLQLASMPRAPRRFVDRVRGRRLRVRDYDEAATVPMWGFDSVDAYYAECSAAPILERIDVPTLLVASRDDPLVPPPPESVRSAAQVRLCLLDRGGHVGFVAGGGTDPDRRWLYWRIVDWLARPRPEP